MKLAVSAYSYAKSKISDGERIRRAAETGFAGIEFTELLEGQEVTHEEKLAYAIMLRREAEACGLAIVAYAIGANMYRGDREADKAEIARLKREVEVAAALGAGVMRHDVVNTEVVNGRVVSFDRMLPTIAENIREVTEYAQTKGVRTCSENHGRLIQDIDRMEKIYNTVGHENYGLLLDIGNFACADEDSAMAVSRVAPFAFHAHAKDFTKRSFAEGPATGYFQTRGCNYLKGEAVGEGDIPVKQCIAILKRAGYDGFLSIEYEGAEDCMIGIKKGLDYLRTILE